MRQLLAIFIMLISSFSAFALSTDRDLFVQITSTTNEETGTVHQVMYGTMALENGKEQNSFISVQISNSGYIYFQGRDSGENFSCYIHESVVSPEQMEHYRTIVAAFTNGSRIRVDKFGHQTRCNGVYLNTNSWQHLN